jgi:NAD(P)-dependent dehydrogenase (short-subunit alcohol dehydrogenase family)
MIDPGERVVVITGAGGGAGSAAARAFAAQGARLALLGRDSGRLEQLAAGFAPDRVLVSSADLLDAAQAKSAAAAVQARFGRADVLLHLVGGWTGGSSLAETSLDDFQSMLDQHVWSTIHTAQAFVPLLAANPGGRLMIVSSPVANHPTARSGAYAAAKAAQEALVLTLASELKAAGGTANILQVKSIDVKGQGSGTTPAELVAAMLYLCSPEAALINGARLPLY